MKKILCVIIVALLTTVLFACNQTESEKNSQTDNTEYDSRQIETAQEKTSQNDVKKLLEDNNAPPYELILQDLQTNEKLQTAGIDDLHIGFSNFIADSFEVVKGELHGNVWSASIKVYSKNNTYLTERSCSIEYKNYDIGGWSCEELRVGDASIIEVLQKPSLSDVRYYLSYLGVKDVYDVKEDDEYLEGEYDNWGASYLFSIKQEGPLMSCTFDKCIIFTLRSSLCWSGTLDDDIDNFQWTIGDLSGIWKIAYSNNEVFFHINSINQAEGIITLDALERDSPWYDELPSVQYKVIDFDYNHSMWENDYAYIVLSPVGAYKRISYEIKGSLTSSEKERTSYTEKEEDGIGPLGSIKITPDKIVCFADPGLEDHTAWSISDYENLRWALSGNPWFTPYLDKWMQ